MVYISSDGKVQSYQPWSLSRIFSIFVGVFTATSLFLRTIIEPLYPDSATSSTGRRSWFGGSGGNGGGGGNDGQGPPRPPRRMGRITHLSDVTVPGGCAGGSCGR